MKVTLNAGLHGTSGLSEADLLTELAIVLYQQEKLSLGHAARLARMDKWAFNDLLAAREVPMHYDAADLARDMATLHRLANR